MEKLKDKSFINNQSSICDYLQLLQKNVEIRPVTIKAANVFVIKFHRHHKQVQGAKFAIGIFSDSDLRGVAICGRPVGRKLDNGLTLEVVRLCVLDMKNGCSMLYSACSRIAKEMGYKKIITYILQSETGISLKASGWNLEANNVGGKAWNSSGNLIRTNEISDLFGTYKKYPSEMKQRWSKSLSNSNKAFYQKK
jgi:hypothetical protein